MLRGISLVAIALSTLIVVGCATKPAKLDPEPQWRMNFSTALTLKKTQLGWKDDSAARSHKAFITVYGIKTLDLSNPPKVFGVPLYDYRISQERLSLYTNSQDYVLTFFHNHEFADWPKKLQITCGSQQMEAVRDQPFYDDHAMFRTAHTPQQKLDAIDVKERDMQWVVLKPDRRISVPPSLVFGEPFAYFECVSDGKGRWAGDIIAFTPNVKSPQITANGRRLTITNGKSIVVTVQDSSARK